MPIISDISKVKHTPWNRRYILNSIFFLCSWYRAS